MTHCPSSFSSLSRSGSENGPLSGPPEADAVEVVLLAGSLSRSHAAPNVASRRRLPAIARRVGVGTAIIYLPCKLLSTPCLKLRIPRGLAVVVGRKYAPAAGAKRERGN